MRWSLCSLALLAGLSMAAPATNSYPAQPLPANSTIIELSNRITACPDKVAREQELLVTFLKQVKKNEHGVLQFLLYYNPINTTFTTFEVYTNQQAIDYHLNTTWIKTLLTDEAAEGTKCAPNNVLIPLTEVYGFVRPGAPNPNIS